MNQDDIINMAKEYADEVTNGYGVVTYEFDLYGLEKFALLIRAAERQWQGLTDEEFKWIVCKNHNPHTQSAKRIRRTIKEIEDTLKEKNT